MGIAALHPSYGLRTGMRQLAPRADVVGEHGGIVADA